MMKRRMPDPVPDLVLAWDPALVLVRVWDRVPALAWRLAPDRWLQM